MSSEFFLGLSGVQNGAKGPCNKGYTQVDCSCSPSPIALSDIADFFRRIIWAAAQRIARKAPVYGTIAADIDDDCDFQAPRKSDLLCKPSV